MKLSLRVVLLISVIGIQLLTVTGFLLSSYFTAQSAMLSHARQLMLEVSRNAIGRSEEFLEPARLTANLTDRLANSKILEINDQSMMERWFFEGLRLYPWFSGVYFGGKDGSFVFVKRERDKAGQETGYLTKIIEYRDGNRNVELVSRDSSFEETSRRIDNTDLFDPRARPWYKLAAKEKKLAWTDPYIFFTSNQPGISAAIPAYTRTDKTFLGAIGVDIEIGQLSSFLRSLKIGERGSAFILNRNGDVIAHPRPELIKRAASNANASPRFVKIAELDDPAARAAFDALDLSSRIVTIKGSAVRRFEYQDERYLAVFTPFFNASWPWTMVIYVPEDDYLGALHKQTRLNIYIGIAVAFFGCILSIVIWRTIARPMRQLSADAEAIQEGDFSTEPKTTSVYREVNATGDAFRKMVVGLREHEEENVHLRRLQSRLLENMRRSAAGHFASAISHELNNPLAAVLTNLQIVSRILKRSDETPSPRLVEAVNGAQSQAERAGSIIRGLRELVEAGEAERAKEDINQVVREAADLVKTDENMAAAQYVYNLADDLPYAMMNRVQIQQVVLNLIRNAVEAMSELDTPLIKISTSAPDSHLVEVSITDSGPGISSTVADKLFQPLITTKPAGMGVGLSICRTIVESHGGKITVSDAPDGGATFTFTIAVTQQNGHMNGRK